MHMARFTILIWAVMTLFAPSSAEPAREAATDDLFLVREKGKGGYINRSGKVVIPLRYEWRYIDKTGASVWVGSDE